MPVVASLLRAQVRALNLGVLGSLARWRRTSGASFDSVASDGIAGLLCQWEVTRVLSISSKGLLIEYLLLVPLASPSACP